MPAGEIALLLHALDTAFDHRAFHGPTLKGVLRGVDADTAAWVPAPERNSIWMLALHCGYWKHRVLVHVAGAMGDDRQASKYPRSPANFAEVPSPPTAKEWKADLALLAATHQTLRTLVAAYPPGKLGARRGQLTIRALIHGAAAHDLYHAGQVALTKRLYAQR